MSPNHDRASTSTQKRRWLRYLPVAVTLCLGVVLAVAAFGAVRNREFRQIQAEFELAARDHIFALEKELSSHLQMVESLSALFSASRGIERHEFKAFVQHFLAREKGIQAFEWIPRVTDAKRPEYEQTARQEGFPHYQIMERNAQGQMVRAGRREEYFPVFFIEPYQGNEAALGFDLASNPARLAALALSRDTGQVVSSGRITLVQEKGNQFGVLIFSPIYQKKTPLDSVEARHGSLQGFALGVFRCGDILTHAFALHAFHAMDVTLYDLSAAPKERFLGSYSATARQAVITPIAPEMNGMQHPNILRHVTVFQVAGRKWAAVCTPAPGYMAAKSTWLPWGVLAAGLIFAGILAAYFLDNLSRTARIEGLVEKRTAELLEANREMEREVTVRKQAEAALAEARDALEQRVEERTWELGSAIEELRREVAERQRGEEALRESEEKYRVLIENANDIILVIQDDRIKFFNPKAFEVFGYSREEIAAKPFTEFVAPKDRDQALGRYRRRLKGEDIPNRYTFQALKKDGQVVWMDLNIVPITWTGRPAVLVLARDITPQIQLESQLRQAQKMEAVGILAGGVAHDFNNLLQTILGYGQLLLAEKEGDESCADLEEIVAAAEKGAALTRQLLTFSRKVESQKAPVDLNDVVRETMKLLERTIPKMITMELHLAEALRTINADAGQLEQVLMNLALNAKDAMPESGRLIFETENVILDEEYCKTHLGARAGSYVLLSVTDTGHGMGKDIIEHIFEPFYTTKERGKGTGLGLATTYGIVKSHDGYIMCYSELGEGTVFKIYLPEIPQEALPAEQKDEEPAVRGGTETILLVDDEEAIRKLGEKILRKFGYTVLTARDGESALKLYQAEQDRIGLVILDLIMPGMGGEKCLAEILKINPEARVAIASGYSPSGQAKPALQGGAMGFIQKPYNIGQMAKLVRSILDESGNGTFVWL